MVQFWDSIPNNLRDWVGQMHFLAFPHRALDDLLHRKLETPKQH